MKTLTLLLAVVATGTAVLAQNNPPAAPAPSAPASLSGPGAVKQYVYLAKLPTPAELIRDAQAEGMTVSRIEQTDDRILVVYQYADGSSQTYAYKLLSSAGGASAPAPAAPATGPETERVTVVEGPPPPPRVVYVDEPERVYYTSSPRYVRYYDPVWDFWAPVSVGINLGFRSGGYYSGGFRGSYHGGGHGGRRH